MDHSEQSRELPSPGTRSETYASFSSGYMGGLPPGGTPDRRPLTVRELEELARRNPVSPNPRHMAPIRPFDVQGNDNYEQSLFGGSFVQPGMPQAPREVPYSGQASCGPVPRGNVHAMSQTAGYLHHNGTYPQPLMQGIHQSPGKMTHYQLHQQSQQDMISDSIAALLQSDLRLSPEGSIIKQQDIPLPKKSVVLPRVYIVDDVPVDVIHWGFFEENPDLWRLYNTDFEANISNILRKYLERIKEVRRMAQTAQNSQIIEKDVERLSSLPGSDGRNNEEDTVKQKYVKQEREERWVDIMDHRHDGRKPIGEMSRLNDALVSMAQELSPLEEDRIAWKKAFDYTEAKIKESFPAENVRVVLFGSVANGLAVRSSNDIDISVECQIRDGEEGEEQKALLIELIGKRLELDRVQDLLILSHARVPVVKFVYPATQTQVDITIKNSLACLNTRMIADYCQIDPRLAQLVHIVKHWAKKRNVNDPYKGTLSSYCYVLMCIFHLQTRSPPILPVLQSPEYPATVSEQVGEWKVEYFDQVSDLKSYNFESKNTQSLAELVWEFFEFWAWKHNYLHDVVSIRLGKIISKESKDWTKRVGRDRHLLCVEDPFLLSHDLGRTVDMKSKDVMRKEFFRAATILRDFVVPEDALFEPYTARQRALSTHRHGPGRSNHKSQTPGKKSSHRHS